MVISASRDPASWRRTASVLFAGLLVAFIAIQARHLVHHFFEPELVQNECPFAASGDRTGGLQVQPVAVAISEVSTPALPAVLPAAPPSVVLAASRGRAPPALVS